MLFGFRVGDFHKLPTDKFDVQFKKVSPTNSDNTDPAHGSRYFQLGSGRCATLDVKLDYSTRMRIVRVYP